MGLWSLIGNLIAPGIGGAIGAAVDVSSSPGPSYAGGVPDPSTSDYFDGFAEPISAYSGPSTYGSGGGRGLAIPDVPLTELQIAGPAGLVGRVVVNWLRRWAAILGPVVAETIYNEWKNRRLRGQSSAQAIQAINQSLYAQHPEARGIRVMRKRRRRMNPANTRALRRAVRRVKSFRRVVRKVHGVLPTRGGHGGSRMIHRRAYRPRRGDLYTPGPYGPEEFADQYDEVEDLGYDPEDYFQEDEE